WDVYVLGFSTLPSRSFHHVLCLLLQTSFFFQAEDGIRDFHVTGVQTCALPICFHPLAADENSAQKGSTISSVVYGMQKSINNTRSEERRVGKECRSWWSPNHLKKKTKIFV